MSRFLFLVLLLASCNFLQTDPEFHTREKAGDYFRIPLIPKNELQSRIPGETPWLLIIPGFHRGRSDSLVVDSVNVYGDYVIFHSPHFTHGEETPQDVWGSIEPRNEQFSTSVSRLVLDGDMEKWGFETWELRPVNEVFAEFERKGRLPWTPKE